MKDAMGEANSGANSDANSEAMNEPAPTIATRESFAAALHWGFQTAIAQGARSVTCVDATFEHWPLDDVGLLESLTTWVRLPQRSLCLLAASYGEVPSRQPRFTAWRRDFAHATVALQAPSEFAADLPTLLLDDKRVSVHLIDAVHWRGRASTAVRTRLLWQEKIDVVLQRSEAGFAVTTLGL